MRNKEHEHDDVRSEETYYTQLLKRFNCLRSTLSQARIYGLTQDSVGTSNQPPSNRHEWLYKLDREYPTPAQISQLDENNIRRGLEYCSHAMDRFDTISGQKSCWIWTLLALSSDIGTLDSRGMSHIRDLGNKAGQYSIELHQGPKHRTPASRNNLADAESKPGDLEDDTEAEQSASYYASENNWSPEMGSVQDKANEHKDASTDNTFNMNASETQDDIQLQETLSQVSKISDDIEGSTYTNTDDSALESARARLLAQLGDNLVQTGIPSAAHNARSTRSDRSELLGQGSVDSQHETKARPMRSRVEAERQRQMMRVQKSATEMSREAQPPYSESSSAVYPVSEEHSTCPVDVNTRVTIDMILTVVAERYGQRDLLRYRKPW